MHKTILVVNLILIALTGNLRAASECEINLVVGYSDLGADSLKGNSNAVRKITEAVENLNRSFVYSEVGHSIHLARTVRMQNAETGCFGCDLDSLQSNAQIATLRDKYHGDLVSLVVTNNEFCGLPISNNELASSSTAFCEVNYKCMEKAFALSHQIGHLYGCSHYIEVRGEKNAAPYSAGHGYKWSFDENTGFQTILGVYDDDFCFESPDDPCNIIPYFSNPKVSYRNVPLGVPGIHDNASILNKNASVLGQFKLVPRIQNNLVDTVQFADMAMASAFDTLSTGNAYVIKDTAQVVFVAEKNITLNPGFRAELGTHFETKLAAPNKECK